MRLSRLRIVVGAIAVVAVVGVVFALSSGEPTNVALTIDGPGGQSEVCASLLTVAGDEDVELGGASVVGPQWLQAVNRTTSARVSGPGVDVSGAADLRVTFVGEDGSVIGQQRVGDDPLAAPAPWSAALVETAPGDEDLTSVFAKGSC